MKVFPQGFDFGLAARTTLSPLWCHIPTPRGLLSVYEAVVVKVGNSPCKRAHGHLWERGAAW